MDLRINIGASVRGLRRGIKQANGLIGKLGNDLGTKIKAGAAIAVGGIISIVTAIASQIPKIIHMSDALGKTSKQIGVTTTEMQKLEFAARRSGASAEHIGTAFRAMSSIIYDAGRGIKESEAVLNRFGLTMDDLRGKTPERQFAMIAAALAKVKDATAQAAMAQDIFSESGVKLLPMLADYGKLADELENIGGVIEEDTVAASEKLKDSWENMTTSMYAALANSGIIDEIQKIIDKITALQLEQGKAAKLQKEFGQEKPPNFLEEWLVLFGKTVAERTLVPKMFGVDWEIPQSTYIGPTTPEQQKKFADQREAKRIELEDAEKNEVSRRERAERQRRADKLNKVQEEAIKQIEKPGDRQARDLAVQKALVGASAMAAKEGRVLTEEERMRVEQKAIKQIEKPGDRQARDLAVQKALVGASATAAKEGRVLTDEERMQVVQKALVSASATAAKEGRVLTDEERMQVEQKAGRDFDQARFERIIDVAMARLSATLPEAFSQEGAQEPAQLRKALEDAIAKQTAKRQQAEDIEKAKLDISITEEAVRERQQLQTEGVQLKEQKAQQAEELKELQSGASDQVIGRTNIVASSLAQIGGANGVRISDAMVTRPLEVQKQIKNLLDQIKRTSDQIQQNTRNIKATEAPRWP